MKKLKKIVASLLAVLMLLGVAPVTALAGEIELHRINTTQQPAEEPAQEPVLGSEDVLRCRSRRTRGGERQRVLPYSPP